MKKQILKTLKTTGLKIVKIVTDVDLNNYVSVIVPNNYPATKFAHEDNSVLDKLRKSQLEWMIRQIQGAVETGAYAIVESHFSIY